MSEPDVLTTVEWYSGRRREVSGKARNPSHSCKACGAPVKANVRLCVACAIQRKAARVGIDPRKVCVGVARPPCTTKEAIGL